MEKESYDLKETETTEAETWNHMLTVLSITFKNYQEEIQGNTPIEECEKTWNEASEYLKEYVKELFKQKMLEHQEK